MSATGYATDRGRRPSNQDAVVAATLPDGREVLAVADGMGGHAAGEVASATALTALVDALDGGAELEDAFHAADAAVRSAAERDRSLDGMGTTLVALLREGAGYRIANVGDSRAYRVSRDGIAQVTRDHSFAEEAARSGRMSAEEIARSPWKSALTRALGTGDALEVDVFGPYEADSAHAVLLCSDGVHGVVGEEEILACVLAAADPASAAERLSSLALRGGSRDNVTVALHDFGILVREEEAAPSPAPAPAAERARHRTRAPAVAPRVHETAKTGVAAPGRRVIERRPAHRKRRIAFPGEGLVFAACCGALAVWLVYFLSSF